MIIQDAVNGMVAIAVGPEVSICLRQTARQPCLGPQVMEQYKSLFFTSLYQVLIDSKNFIDSSLCLIDQL